jgi:hypothetical protein
VWEPVGENWDRAYEVIEDIPRRHLEKIKAEAPGYWKQQREVWRQGFEQELLEFKKEREAWGIKPLDELVRLERSAKARIWVQEEALKRRIAETKLWIEVEKEKLLCRTGNLPKERRWTPDGRISEEVRAMKAETQEKIDRMERNIKNWTHNCEVELKEIREG